MDELSRYRKAVLTFTNCHYSLLEAIRLIDKGRKVKKDLKKLTLDYIKAKESLLSSKQEMGYDDGLTFLRDFNNFKGFKVEEGEVKGNVQFSADIIEPWIKGFPTTSNNYQFEVAMLVLSQLR